MRALSTKSHLVSLLHAQLSGATSLRDVVATFASHHTRLYHLGVEAPKRSTLADANRDRPADLFVELFQSLLKQAHPGLRRATRDAVHLIDSSSLRGSYAPISCIAKPSISCPSPNHHRRGRYPTN